MLSEHIYVSNSLILLSSKFHHFISSKSDICSSVNLFLINLAGFPPTIEYGSTFLTTLLLAAIIAPSPMVMPVSIVTP